MGIWSQLSELAKNVNKATGGDPSKSGFDAVNDMVTRANANKQPAPAEAVSAPAAPDFSKLVNPKDHPTLSSADVKPGTEVAPPQVSAGVAQQQQQGASR